MNSTEAKRKALTFDKLVAGGDRPYEMFELPEMVDGDAPGVIYLRHAAAGDVMKLVEMPSETAEEKAAMASAQYLLIARCIVDENGERTVADENAGAMAQLPATALMRILRKLTSGFKDKEGNV